MTAGPDPHRQQIDKQFNQRDFTHPLQVPEVFSDDAGSSITLPNTIFNDVLPNQGFGKAAKAQQAFQAIAPGRIHLTPREGVQAKVAVAVR